MDTASSLSHSGPTPGGLGPAAGPRPAAEGVGRQSPGSVQPGGAVSQSSCAQGNRGCSPHSPGGGPGGGRVSTHALCLPSWGPCRASCIRGSGPQSGSGLESSESWGRPAREDPAPGISGHSACAQIPLGRDFVTDPGGVAGSFVPCGGRGTGRGSGERTVKAPSLVRAWPHSQLFSPGGGKAFALVKTDCRDTQVTNGPSPPVALSTFTRVSSRHRRTLQNFPPSPQTLCPH